MAFWKMAIKARGPLFAWLVIAVAGIVGLFVQHSEPHNRGQPTVAPYKNTQDGKFVATQTANQNSKKGEQESNWIEGLFDKPTDTLLVVFNGLLVLFTGLLYCATAGLFKETAELRRIANEQRVDLLRSIIAAEKSANAAKQSADHIPTVERAYVFATPVAAIENNMTVTTFRIENFGQTPGFVSEEYGCGSETEPTGAPTYNKGHPRFIAAIVQKGTADRSPTRWLSPITTPHYFFGYIKYTDIFQKEHISRVCKRIFPADGKIDVAGPPAWNEWD